MKIQSDEQYESIKGLGYLVEKLGIIKGFVEDFVYEVGGDFEPCDDCMNVINECSCRQEGDDYYSDDMSFE
jgi:hypothetical protein